MSATTEVAGAGGAIAGQWLGRIVGGAAGTLIGPEGTVIGGWIGGRVGAVAGRAAASAIASYMESANADADAKTKDAEQAKPCVDCGEIDCFNPPEGSSPEEIEEFKRQLKEQQDAINETPPDQLVKNMENYEKLGRGAQDALDRANAREAWIKNRAAEILKTDANATAKTARASAANEIKTMDVIHTPDLSAVGTGRLSTQNGGMGPRSTNRSIGSQWSKTGPNFDKTRLQQLKEHAQNAKDKGKATNADLKICEDGKSPKIRQVGIQRFPRYRRRAGWSGQYAHVIALDLRFWLRFLIGDRVNNYQARLDSVVEDFGSPQGPDTGFDPEVHRGKVPEAMIDFWKQNGIGTVLDGYFQFCAPEKYRGIMELVFRGDQDLDAERTHALGFGAFGTMVAWHEVHQDVTINLVNGQVSCPALVNGKTFDPDMAVTSQLMMIDDPTLDEYDADVKKLFKPARAKLGKLGVGQIYGFKPILALGGNRDLGSLAIYEALPHMAILAQAHHLQLMDNAPYPPQPVRVIGS